MENSLVHFVSGENECKFIKREPIYTNTGHPGYPVRENTNIPTNLLEVVPLLA